MDGQTQGQTDRQNCYINIARSMLTRKEKKIYPRM